MLRWRLVGCAVSVLLLAAAPGSGQTSDAGGLSQLIALRDKVGDADTRVRVSALHRVWSIALASGDPEVKLTALGLLGDPVGSASDHIRMPAVYAIAEIANSARDSRVKLRALEALAEPLRASQVPIRDVAIDAVNSITRSAGDAAVAQAAVRALGPPVRSGNNGVRIPAINALVRAVEGSGDPVASQAALDLLVAALDSSAMIGGMEVRMMAVAAMEKIGLGISDVGAKAKAMGLLQAYASRGGWEAEARTRAQDAARAIEATLRQP
jgi:hypothetical protein